MLLPELAIRVVQEVRKLIDEEIIVVNKDGIIIASTDQGRVGRFHEGALIASTKQKKLIITQEDQLVLNGVKAGINFPIFFQNDVIGVIGITGEPSKVNSFGEIIRKMTELLISENYYAEQFEWHSRALESFVMDWLQTKEWDEAFINKARLLSINLQAKRIVAIIQFSHISQPLSRDIWSTMFKWINPANNEVATRLGNERVALFFDCENSPSKTNIEKRLTLFLEFLEKNFGLQAYAGVGSVVNATDIQLSYLQAERALKSAKKLKQIIFDENLKFEMILDELSPKTKNEFISRTIGPIIHETELLETVRELFRQNHSLKITAQNLHIHINTLHYRLKKVEEMTGLNHQNLHDLLTLYLALQLLDEHPKTNE